MKADDFSLEQIAEFFNQIGYGDRRDWEPSPLNDAHRIAWLRSGKPMLPGKPMLHLLTEADAREIVRGKLREKFLQTAYPGGEDGPHPLLVGLAKLREEIAPYSEFHLKWDDWLDDVIEGLRAL